MSSFHGLEMAKQALFTQQMGLYVTGHNISNLNTKGYSRQRVNLETLTPYPTPGRTAARIPGQIGTGVQAGTVQRIRDHFLDMQYRTQNSMYNYYGTKYTALSRMESIMNEADGSAGLNQILDDFWNSLSDLSGNPNLQGTRKVVVENALAVTDTFQHLSKSIETIRQDLKFQIGREDGSDSSLGNVNSILRQINELNKQIKLIEPHGLLPNDLYDRRDNLIDELSGIVDIRVTYDGSGGGALPIADGIAKIELVNSNGDVLNPPGPLLGDNIEPNEFVIEYDAANGGAVRTVKYGNDEINIMDVNGSLKGLVENYGYIDENGNVVGHFPEMLANLDKMAVAFAERFNEVHRQGFDLNKQNPTIDFFVIGAGGAKTITVNQAIRDDASLIAASANGDTGDGSHASLLGEVLTEDLPGNPPPLGAETSVKEFYDGLIASLGVITREAGRKTEDREIQRNDVIQRKNSVSEVSLDDEVTNLIKFQHAYNAAARSLTAMDEILEKIINGMGIVGR